MIESLFFWTGQGFQLLANSDNWFRDGTFKVYPEVFFQLYTVHAKLAGTVLPCISALLPNKQGFTYTRLFQHVLAAVEPLQNGPSMMILILKNLPWMLQKMFLKSFFFEFSCFFHLLSNIWKQIQNNGLQERYVETLSLHYTCVWSRHWHLYPQRMLSLASIYYVIKFVWHMEMMPIEFWIISRTTT